MDGLQGNVFVTGGAGFLARGIYARARAEAWPCRFTAFSRDAHKHAALRRDFPEVRTLAGDVAADVDRLALALAGHQIVIHAAAYKYVDLAETNVWECIRTNVLGSLTVAQAAVQASVQQVIGISTDKACQSVNEYGGSKYQMEKAFQEANTWQSETRFHLTRYGNVLAATGSMVKDWRRKLKEQGYVNATDPDMTRFWLSVEQAVDLILLSLSEPAGTITIPKLPALSMKRMEEYILPPGTRITYDGMRPGEKRHEMLLTPEESRFAECRGMDSYYRLYPVWTKPIYELLVDGSQGFGYTSDKPIREMTRAELLAIVGDA